MEEKRTHKVAKAATVVCHVRHKWTQQLNNRPFFGSDSSVLKSNVSFPFEKSLLVHWSVWRLQPTVEKYATQNHQCYVKTSDIPKQLHNNMLVTLEQEGIAEFSFISNNITAQMTWLVLENLLRKVCLVLQWKPDSLNQNSCPHMNSAFVMVEGKSPVSQALFLGQQ